MRATEAIAIAKLQFDCSKEKLIISEMYSLLCHVTAADKAVLSLNSAEISEKIGGPLEIDSEFKVFALPNFPFLFCKLCRFKSFYKF